MKNKTALLLLLVILVSSVVSVPVAAVSANGVNKIIKMEQGDTLNNDTAPILSINPNNVVDAGTTVKIELTGAVWAFGQITAPAATGVNWANYGATGAQWRNFSTGVDTWEKYEDELGKGTIDSNVLRDAINNQNVIPWKLEVSPTDSKTAILTLAPITLSQLKNSRTGSKDADYEIPLIVKATSAGGSINVNVNGIGTAISNSSHTFAVVGGTQPEFPSMSSVNNVTKIIQVESGQTINDNNLILSINPDFVVKKGDTIELELTGAVWAFDQITAPSDIGVKWTNYGATGAQWRNFSTGVDTWEKYEEELGKGAGESSVLIAAIEYQNVIPWKLEVSPIDSKAAILTLAPITAMQLKNSGTGSKDAAYEIPLVVKATSSAGSININVNGVGTTISNSSHTFAVAGGAQPEFPSTSSVNAVDKIIRVESGQLLEKDASMLSIDPNYIVQKGEKIELELTGAVWAFDQVTAPSAAGAKWANYGATGAQWRNFSTSVDTWEKYEEELGTGLIDSNVLREAIEYQNVIPWKLEVSPLDPRIAIVTLAPITSRQLKNSSSGTKDAAYEIPLIAKTTVSEGNIKVSVNGVGTPISNSKHTIALLGDAQPEFPSTASINNINKTIIAETGQILKKEEVVLSINPNHVITLNPGFIYGESESIKLELTGAVWAFDQVAAPTVIGANWANYGTNGAQWRNFNTGDTWTKYEEQVIIGLADSYVLRDAIDYQNVIPWKLEVSATDPRIAIVTLAPITLRQLKNSSSGAKDAAYEIPLIVKTTASEGSVTVHVDGIGMPIANSTHTLALVDNSQTKEEPVAINFTKSLTVQNGVIAGDVEVNVKNNTGDITPAVIVIAIYDGRGRLIYSESSGESLAVGSNAVNFTGISIPNSTAGRYKVKIMCWESLSDMTPLAQYKTFDLK